MLYAVFKDEKKKKLHSVVKESRQFKFQLHMALEECETNMIATKAAKEVKQKAKQACEEDMKKTWRQKPQHGGYQQRMSNGDVDKATTHQWFGSSI